MIQSALFDHLTEEQKNVLRKFKVFLTDYDGCHTNGTETRIVLPLVKYSIPMYEGASPVEVPQQSGILKTRSFYDGQAVSFLRAIGVTVLFVSGEGEPLNTIVAKWNTLPSCKSGAWKQVELFSGQIAKGNKIDAISKWLEEKNIDWIDCIYLGDDLNDVEPMKRVPLAFAPANAQRCVRNIPGVIVLANSGGDGAVRELAEAVLDCRNVDESTLPPA